MFNEEWLCNTLKLCNLVSGSESDRFDASDSMQVVINNNSYPQPAYNQPSVQLTLEACSRLLDTASEWNMEHTNQKVMEQGDVQTESVHHFAKMTAKSIMDSAMMIGETPSIKHDVNYNPENICDITEPCEFIKVGENDIEMLAAELTLQVCCNALEELGRHCVPCCSEDLSVLTLPPKDSDDTGVMKGKSENASGLHCSGSHCVDDTSEMDTKMEECDDTSGAAVYAPSLNSMASLGSIDYPDAPPSTPLLPEMMKSRASFTRKLKGGLAKEFLPSTPPPTPKDYQMQNQVTDAPADKSDFIVRLMRSLSLEYCQHEEEEEAEEFDDGEHQNEIARLCDYAAQLSADIIRFITANKIDITEEGSVTHMQAIAEQVADTIVTTSIAEVISIEQGDRKRDQSDTSVAKKETASYLHKSFTVDMAPDVAVQQRSSMAFSAAEEVKVLASQLIINAVVHAFAKLRQFKHETHPHLSGLALEPQPWEEERYSNTNLCKDSTQSHEAKTFTCCNDKSELNPITLDARNMTSSAVHTFAVNFAVEVLGNSVQDASSFLINYRQLQGTDKKTGSWRDIKPCLIKIHAEEGCDVQELQCVLLWAVASQRGTSALQFDLPDTNLQQQLCRLSRSAHLNGWTVGALMASLYQFCDIQQETSRGHYKSSDSLLNYLHSLIDNTCFN